MKRMFRLYAAAAVLAACTPGAGADCTGSSGAAYNLRDKLSLPQGENAASAGADFWFGSKVSVVYSLL